MVTEVGLAARKPHLPPSQPIASTDTTCTTYGIPADLREYAQRLLASFPSPGAGIRVRTEGGEQETDLDLQREEQDDEEGGLTGCREAVEILTRIPKKGQSIRSFGDCSD